MSPAPQAQDSASFLDVLFEHQGSRTDSSGLHHVSDCESLYRLVFGGASRAIGAAHRLDVAAAFLVSPVTGALFDHDDCVLLQDGFPSKETSNLCAPRDAQIAA